MHSGLGAIHKIRDVIRGGRIFEHLLHIVHGESGKTVAVTSRFDIHGTFLDITK